MPAPTNISQLVTRDQFESYIMQDNGGVLIGDGFSTLKESKNPKEYTRKYVNMKTEKTDVIGYSPSIEYTLDVYSQSPVIDIFVTIADEEKTGDDAMVRITNVNKWKVNQDGKYYAVQRLYCVVPSDKADGTDALIYSGTMKAASDLVIGTWDDELKTFTPNS